MAKYAPQYDTFQIVLKLDHINKFIVWAVFTLSLLPYFFKQIGWDGSNSVIAVQTIEYVNIILLIIGFILNAIKDYHLFPLAESKRRKDLIDNAFSTKYSLKNSEEYYTNEEVNPGINKLGVNLFQNLFFTVTVTKGMRAKVIVKSSLFLVVFILMAIYGFKNSPLALPILQILFSAFVLGDLIKLLLFIHRNEIILENIQQYFSEAQNNEATVLKSFVEYETNLSWASILLDGKVFNKINDQTEKEWQLIKEKYQIQ